MIFFQFLSFFHMEANSVDPDQVPRSVASDLFVLFVCFLTTHQPLWVISVRRY